MGPRVWSALPKPLPAGSLHFPIRHPGSGEVCVQLPRGPRGMAITVQVVSDAPGESVAIPKFPRIPKAIPWTACGEGGSLKAPSWVPPKNPSWRGQLGALGVGSGTTGLSSLMTGLPKCLFLGSSDL